MSYDPGPLVRENFDSAGPLARVLSLFQQRVADWIDRLRTGEGWVDLQGSATEGLSNSSLTTQEVPSGSSVLFPCWRHDQTDDITLSKQFSHRWTGHGARPHIHLMPLADAAGNIAFSWKYALLGVNGKLDTYTDMGEVVFPVTAENRYDHLVLPLGHIEPPERLGLTSAFLVISLTRNRDGGDTYDTTKGWGIGAANVALLGIDSHNRERLFGSTQEYR